MKDLSRKIFLLTVDVEEIPLKDGTIDYSSITEGIPPLLGLFEEFHVRSTFFITGKATEKTSETLKKILERGHEIGCHGYKHDISLAESLQFTDLREATRVIAEQMNVVPLGYRAPFHAINEKTLQYLIGLGFKYDSSIVPSSKMINKHYFPDAPTTPYRPSIHHIDEKGEAPLIEVPISTMPIVNLPLGLIYFLLLGSSLSKRLLSRICNQEIVTLYLHPYDILSLPSNAKVSRQFIIANRMGRGRGYRVLRDLLEYFEREFDPSYVCAKEILPLVSRMEVS